MSLLMLADSVVGIVRAREGALVMFWLGDWSRISWRTSSVELLSSRSVPRDAGSSRTTLGYYRKMISFIQDRKVSILTGATRASCMGHSSSSVRRTESALLITIKVPTTLLDKPHIR